MKRYIAHCIMRVKYRDSVPSGTNISLWENIIYIQANSTEEAWRKACAQGAITEDTSEYFHCDGKPAELLFAGVRKLIEIDQPVDDGVELTFIELEVATEEDLALLMELKKVNVVYVDE